MQTGEPLLNAVVHAAAWTHFLTQRGYTLFQGGEDHTLVREAPLVRRHPHLLGEAARGRLDTAVTANGLGVDGTYFAAYGLACAFDLGRIRCDGYLERLGVLLAIADHLQAKRGSAPVVSLALSTVRAFVKIRARPSSRAAPSGHHGRAQEDCPKPQVLTIRRSV